MTADRDAMDAFLDEALAEALDDPAALAALHALADALAPIVPAPSTRAGIMDAAVATGRFERFAAALAGLIDVTVAAARAILDAFERDPAWEAGPLPVGCASLWIAGGPATAGCIRGFIRLAAGATFPEHTHLGAESVLVMQGSMLDLQSGRRSRPGDIVTMPAGSRHSFTVPPGGPDLLYFVVVRDGVELGGEIIRSRDDAGL